MRFSQTIVLAVLAVTAFASPILPRWDQVSNVDGHSPPVTKTNMACPHVGLAEL